MTDKHGKTFKRIVGTRKVRCFKVYLEMPDQTPEDEVMDYIEDAVREYKEYEPGRRAHGFDKDTVCVRRATPKMAP